MEEKITQGPESSTGEAKELDGTLTFLRDYYMENGLMVFTADFLARRGYCCESGCRHCPYGFIKEER